MKKLTAFVLYFSLFISNSVRADFWGGDLIYLAQILENAIKQYIELKNIVETGKDQLNLIRDINRGINDSMRLAQTINPNINPGIYNDWNNVNFALGQLHSIYGRAPESPESRVYSDTDQNVAEAVTMNNEIYKYTQNMDELGEAIKEYSHDVSPGGAQKLTAQTLGVMLQLMNQSLRTQATGLKLQAQTMAVQNKKEKDSTKQYLETANTLRFAMKNEKIQFEAPRF